MPHGTKENAVTPGNSKSKRSSGKSSKSDDPFVGKTFGNCKILEKINEGGTAYIYKAFNTSFKLNRVVKILKPSLNDEGDFYHRFIREAQLTARLDHPNILRVFNTGAIDGFFYIEMEYIDGKSLRSLISARNKISERETLTIAAQLVRALNYAHNVKIKTPSGDVINGILHRDIKPENVMLTSNNIVKLMDFGAAKPLNLTSNTMQGMIVGTFHYMSPEQLEGNRLDSRSDFFSLGILLYELFTCQKPFASEKLVTLIEKIKSCKYTPVRKIRPSISPVSEELVEKLLSKKVNHRPQNAQEILETIQICLHTYDSWGAGKPVKVPFSLKRFFPSFSLLFSVAALSVSLFTYLNPRIPALQSTPSLSLKKSSLSLLEKGRDAEEKGMWQEAESVYELVPSTQEGGIANEYLEAHIRRAYICFTQLNQFTKARSILEKLRMDFSDPAIDAYLGQIYFRLALYNEARDRLNSAINSKKGSVIQQSNEFKRELYYYYANSLDRQYIYVSRDPALLVEALKAWNYYCEFSQCKDNNSDKDCTFAQERIKELESIAQKS